MSARGGSPVQAALMIAMFFCLVFEGLIIALSGFPFRGLPIEAYVVGIVWIGSCISTFYYPKKPLFALIAGWIMLAVTSISMSKGRPISYSALGYLFHHFIELLYIVASHLGYFVALRNRTLAGRRI